MFLAVLVHSERFFGGAMYHEMFRLDKRVAVVTGGARGIGNEIAFALADVGAKVVIADLTLEAAQDGVSKLESRGAKATAMKVDVTDTSSVNALAEKVVLDFGRIDILVNNAGVAELVDTIDMTDEGWLNTMDVNINGVFWCSRAFGRYMVAQGKGAIVNIGSMSGIIVNRPQVAPPYMASKAATNHLARALGTEWAEQGVRVNSVAPGYIATEMTADMRDNEEMFSTNVDMTPMKRFGNPSEVAAFVLFLASDAASYCTGGVYMVDGGYTAW